MSRAALIAVKVVAAFSVAACVSALSAGGELVISVITCALIVAGALALSLGARRTQVGAGCFLIAVPLVQHGVDRYYWLGVYDHGLWWPWSESNTGLGSIAGEVGQVADLSSIGLIVLAAVLAVLVRGRRPQVHRAG